MSIQRYRYRAYPDIGQQRSLARLFGCVRVAYNDALALRKAAHTNGEKITRAQVSRALTLSKEKPERAWLAQVSSVPLQQAIADADRAYRNFFDSISGKRKGRRVGHPKFRKRSAGQSARFTANAGYKVRSTSHGVGFVRLPKVGDVRFELSRDLPSTPSSVSVIVEPDGRYYVSFVVNVPAVERASTANRSAGVDVGLHDLAAIVYSDGTREKVANPRWERARARKLARAQRALSRAQRGSANRVKAWRAVAVQHRKTREARSDHHHKLALRLVRENQAVAVEGLSIVGLARARNARSVHDAGWGILLRLLAEKAPRYGCKVTVADRWAPTSQVCSVCGAKDGPKPLSIRVWTCPTCGVSLDRDWNAAVNVMVAAGLAETLNAGGGSVRRVLACADPTKQVPAERTSPDGAAA